MSQANVEIVRVAVDRISAGDVEAFLQLCSPDLEFRDLPALPGSGIFVGHDAFRNRAAQVLDAFEESGFYAEEFIPAGDRVVVINRWKGRGLGSGVDVEMRFTNVWTLREEKVVSCITYNDHADALRAAGLTG